MESVGHSRLLKHLLPPDYLSKMADKRFKFDYKEPEHVNSHVPGEQKLREEPDSTDMALSTDIQGDTVDNPEDYILAPVVTITKTEATYTKGDLKLQKEIPNGVFHTIKDPSYPEIISDVIHDNQPIRGMEEGGVEHRHTRIPKLRFRQAVNRVRREKSESDKSRKEQTKQIPRRSSIPKLKKRPTESAVKENVKPEDEFDKIYDEIVANDEEIDENILNTNVVDPSNVETCFDEIIHAYDDHEIEPIAVDEVKHNNEKKPEPETVKNTKIPMLRRKSEHEAEVPKPAERANKLGDRIKVREAVSKFANVDKSNYKPRRLPVRSGIPKKVSNNDTTSDDRVHTKVVNDVKKYEVQIENVNVKVSYEKGIEPENVMIDDNIIKSHEAQESVVEDNDFQAEPEVTKCEMHVQETEEIIKHDITEIVEHKAPIYNETIEFLPTKEIDDVEIKTVDNNVVIEPVKVTFIEEMENLTNKPNNQETVQHETTFEPAVPINIVTATYDIPTEETIEYNDVTNNSSNDIPRANEDTKLQSKDINPRENELKNYGIEDSDEDGPILKGKVNRMISRLSSREPNEEPKIDIDSELPKTKSVLSKIAMFERQEPTDAVFKRDPTIPKCNFRRHPRRATTEEPICYKPKIVNEVLKPAPRIDSNGISNNDFVTNKSEGGSNNIVTKEIKSHLSIEEVSPPTLAVEDYVKDYVVNDEQKAFNDVKEVISESKSYVHENKNDDGIVEIEIKPADTYEVEYIQPINQIDRTTDEIPSNIHVIRVQNENEGFINRMNENPFDFKPKNINDDERDQTSLDSKYRRYKSINDEAGLKRVKSLAELDLGDAVKGRVHEMITRMKSVEKLNVGKREVISVKERPRKKSVSEKIALFEGKITQVSSLTSARALKVAAPKPAETLSEEEYQAKIAELSNAKLTYGRVTNMTYMVLANGIEMPVLALGTALLDKKLTPHIIESALELGYRAIDTAFIYGNEREVGEGIRRKIEDGTVQREDLFVISKLWSTYHRTDLVEEACRKSLKNLGLDYFDLFLIHNPMSFKEGSDPLPKIANVLQYSDHDYLDAWFGMEQLVIKGLVKSIGVSNFNSSQLQRVVEKARVQPVINQVECHPYLSQQRLNDFCSERKVRLSCFGVLGSKGTPPDLKSAVPPVIDDPLVQVMSAGLGITPAQLLIRYQIENGHAVVVKGSTGAHLWDNLQALSISISAGQMDALASLNRNKRTFTFKGMGDTHKNYPFKAAF